MFLLNGFAKAGVTLIIQTNTEPKNDTTLFKGLLTRCFSKLAQKKTASKTTYFCCFAR